MPPSPLALLAGPKWIVGAGGERALDRVVADLGGERARDDRSVRWAGRLPPSPVLDWRSYAQDGEGGERVRVAGQESYRERMMAYGEFIASLAAWSEFVTLTHRPLDRRGNWTRVGISYHRRLVRNWFYGEHEFYGRGVRDVDPVARLWGETELHASGVPHEHALLATNVDAWDRVAMRDVWREVCGSQLKHQGAYFEHIDRVVDAAGYVAKYTEKSSSKSPRIFGFGTPTRLVDALPLLAWARASELLAD